MKKYINKNLGKDFIKLNLSIVVASILLIEKPNDSLRFCIDYRLFNAIIVENQYLILLLNKALKKLSSAIWFIKLNIIRVFNKNWIQKNHE